MTTTILLRHIAVLRDATFSLHGPEVPFGLAQALLVLALVVLFVILTGVVFLRVRRSSSSRTRSK